MKVGKRQPFTIDRFDEFFRLLPDRADSDRSWTVDIAERKRRAAEESAPIKREANAKEQEAARWKEELAKLKKAKPRDQAKIDEVNGRIKDIRKEARDLLRRAEAIDNAVYDLKAVNPNAVAEEDTRTPEELLDLIEAKGREIDEAVASLRRGQVQ